ncbi:MAG: hypothetical protein JO019_01830 [Candidatus Kaiserbacteria bacterium]|nr:hypothetical protein [Candidatus Kaiserbacteria bacterium]
MKRGRFAAAIRRSPFLSGLQEYPTTELIAAGIGILAVLLALIFMLVPFPSGRPELTTSAPLSVGSPQFLDALAAVTNSSVRFGDRVEPVQNGDGFLAALEASIPRAKHSINFEDFIWYDGEFSDHVFDLLTAAAMRGVEVRVLVDAQGAKLPDDKVKALKAAGGKVELFRPNSIFSLNRINARSHRRTMVIDGTEGYLGGVAIADDWLGNGTDPNKWRDMMFRVHGDMAENLQDAFSTDWFETTGEVISGPDFFPTVAKGTVPYVPVVTEPTEYTTPVESLYVLSIRSATSTIYITNPYFVPDVEMRNALEDAARRGVDIRVLIPAPHSSPVHHASEASYSELLKSGIRIYEYPGLLHTKTLVADDIWSIIGSANLDNRSRAINEENDMGVSDPVLAKQLYATFASDTATSTEVTKDAWAKRAFWEYIPSRLSLLFVKQY